VAMIGMPQKPSEQSIKLLVSRCADIHDVNAGVMFVMLAAIDKWEVGSQMVFSVLPAGSQNVCLCSSSEACDMAAWCWDS